MSIKVHEALAQIKEIGLDRFRCNLTGAPYATIDESEIILALKTMLLEDPAASIARLVDQWELRSLAFNTRTIPALIGAEKKALLAITQSANGQARALSYMLTRLLFPKIGFDAPTEMQKKRMQFAIAMHDTASGWNQLHVTGLVQQLVVVDSYLSMPHWHTLWLFESAFSKVGLEASPAAIKEVFSDPSVLIQNHKRIEALIEFMYKLMLHCAERDGAAGKSGNRLAQEIMFIQAAATPEIVIPHFQKTLSEADRIRLENKRRLDSKTELRIAHSAIHGKKHLPGANVSQLNRMAAEMTANMAKKKEKVKTESKQEAAKTRNLSTINPAFRAAFLAAVDKK